MTTRVFWKILIGFWITSFLIAQVVWLMFVVLRPPETVIDTGPFVSSAVTALLERDGGTRLRQDISKWPVFWQKQVEIIPAAAGTLGAIRGADNLNYRIIIHPPPDRHRHDHSFFSPPWQVVVVSIIGGLAFSAILAAYLTSPVGRLRAGFKRLAEGDFEARLGKSVGRRRDEIADLAHDFDVMASRLQELVTHRDRLLAGVSHELRSPLTRLQLAIGLAQKYPDKKDSSLQRISREAEKLDEMVEEILTLAKLESGVDADEEYVDIADVTRQIAEDANFEGAAKGISVELDPEANAPSELVVMGSGKLIARAIDNIVRNALRFSSEGQTVHIGLKQEDKTVTISVRDEGPGIAAEQLENLFKPFVQGAGGDGNGFGLGLAIAERAILAHHGTISARNLASGGLEIRMILPATVIASMPSQPASALPC